MRLGVDPRKADQMVRGTVALPVGHRQGRPRRGVRPGRRRHRGPRRRRRLRGRRRPRRRGRGRHARLRRRHRHPRPHAPGRQARPGARPPRPDAEPQDRHGHHRRGQGRRRLQGRQGRVPHRPLRQRARADRQGQLRRRRPSAANLRAVLEELERAKPASAKGRYFKRITLASTMGPGIKIDPTRMFAADDAAA